MEAIVIHESNGSLRATHVREEVANFATQMETVMSLHDQEHPNGEADSLDMLYDHLLEEAEELNQEFAQLRPGQPYVKNLEEISREAIDLANMCMFVVRKADRMIKEIKNASNPGT